MRQNDVEIAFSDLFSEWRTQPNLNKPPAHKDIHSPRKDWVYIAGTRKGRKQVWTTLWGVLTPVVAEKLLPQMLVGPPTSVVLIRSKDTRVQAWASDETSIQMVPAGVVLDIPTFVNSFIPNR